MKWLRSQKLSHCHHITIIHWGWMHPRKSQERWGPSNNSLRIRILTSRKNMKILRMLYLRKNQKMSIYLHHKSLRNPSIFWRKKKKTIMIYNLNRVLCTKENRNILIIFKKVQVLIQKSTKGRLSSRDRLMIYTTTLSVDKTKVLRSKASWIKSN